MPTLPFRTSAVPSRGLLGIIAVVMVVLFLSFYFAGEPLLWLILVPTVPVLVACSWYRVEITKEGFQVASVLGLPRKYLPIEEITAADTTHINPWDWGGWGWRLNGKDTAVVTTTGTGLRIQHGKKEFLVTCEHPEEAARLLQSLIRPA